MRSDGQSGKRRRAFRLAALVSTALALLHTLANRDSAGPTGIAAAYRLELALLDLDYRVRAVLAPPGPPDSRLVVVGLDERSLAASTRYSSEPDFFAAVLAKIVAAKPRVVVLDVLFQYQLLGSVLRDRLGQLESEMTADGSLTERGRRSVEAMKAEVDVEGRLSAALSSVPSLIPFGCDPQLLRGDDDADAELLGRAWTLSAPDTILRAQPVDRFLAPLPSLVRAATAVAQSCELPDADGTLRNDLTVIATARRGSIRLVPALPVVAAAMTEGLDASVLTIDAAGLHLGARVLPLDREGRMLIDYGGGSGSFRSRAKMGSPSVYSATDVLDGQVRADRLAGKTVLVGTIRALQRDMKTTPFTHGENVLKTSGLERIAMQTDSILSGRPIPRRPSWAGTFGFLATVLLGMLGAFAGTRLSPAKALGLGIALSTAAILAGIAAFTWGLMWLDSGFPALAALIPVSVSVLLVYSAEQDEKRFLQNAFSMYVAPELVQSILREGSVELQGEERELTILFADLRNFTRSSGEIPAEHIVAMLNEHLTSMSDVILRHGGTLDKFIGDAVMAFWNAPVADSDHARRACAASLEMLRVLEEMNSARVLRGEPTQEMGIGLATGKVIVGNIGARDRRFNYTAIGDAVNVASRLEGLTKNSDYRVLVGEETRARAGDGVGFVELGNFAVKGKNDGVPVFGIASSRRASQRSATGSG